MSTKNETVLTNISINKIPGSDGFIGELYQIFKEKLTLILLKLFTKIEETVSKLNLQCQLTRHQRQIQVMKTKG